MKKTLSRKEFVQKCLYGTTLLIGAGAFLASCNSEKSGSGEQDIEESTPTASNETQRTSADPQVTSCDDMRGVSASEFDKRKKLGYVEQSPIPDNQCNNCNLYTPPKDGAKCGGCMLFKGPVNAEGYCSYYAPPA